MSQCQKQFLAFFRFAWIQNRFRQRLEACVADFAQSCASRHLQLNADKMETMLVGSRASIGKLGSVVAGQLQNGQTNHHRILLMSCSPSEWRQHELTATIPYRTWESTLFLMPVRPLGTNYPKASASCKLHLSNTNLRHFSSNSVITLQTDSFYYLLILVLLSALCTYVHGHTVIGAL